MAYFRTKNDGDLERAVVAYRSGKMSRRAFISRAMAVGVTAGMAGALATAWSGRALAQSTETSPVPEGEFDFIVIGTGSAGAACVHQLARTGARILVLEAGRNDDLEEVHDSRLWGASLGTDATKVVRDAARDACRQPPAYVAARERAGRNVGAQRHDLRPRHHSDYASWVEHGATGWSFEDVLPAFMEMETCEFGGENRGTSGPLFISQPQDEFKHEGAIAFMNACAELGFEETPSINSERMSGQAWVDFNIRDQRRQSSATAFLRPAMESGNVTVLTHAPVQRLNFEGTRCTGVTYLHNGAPVTVAAQKRGNPVGRSHR